MTPSKEGLEVTVILNNLKGHTFSVSNYAMSENEAKIVVNALERYLADLKFEQELKVY